MEPQLKRPNETVPQPLKKMRQATFGDNADIKNQYPPNVTL